MCNCNKISTCGEWTFSTCVKYEGILPVTSKYYNECDVSVQDAIEELYSVAGNTIIGLVANTNVLINNFLILLIKMFTNIFYQ